jgi:hypothetical protein
MSQKFPGGIISKTAPVPTGPFEDGTAPGVWTLEQQAEFVKQGIWPIAGNVPNYIEDVFSTWLYTGNGGSNPINNGIDLAGKGGMVWIKSRTTTNWHVLTDTVRGAGQNLFSNDTSGQQDFSQPTFTSTGFNLSLNNSDMNGAAGQSYASWTFRKQPKFFDVVTYTGDATAGRTIAHNLGSVPGCIIVKRLNGADNWTVYHRGIDSTNPQNYIIYLNTTEARSDQDLWADTAPTSTVFSVGDNIKVNGNSSNTYVAYLFAHDAGGFGLEGTDNVISCGSYVGNGSASGPVIDLGYEPQWVMVKLSSASGSEWVITDTMRGMPVGPNDLYLAANDSFAEQTNTNDSFIDPLSTGFTVSNNFSNWNSSGQTYIYIAIRRGPMKVPTDGTSVFNVVTDNSNAYTVKTTGFPVDFQLARYVATATTDNTTAISRLTGFAYDSTGTNRALVTSSTDGENNKRTALSWDNMTGFTVPDEFKSLIRSIYYSYRRAPGYMDVVCYTGTGSATTVAHNLAAVPELMITKLRSGTQSWFVFSNITPSNFRRLNLNLADSSADNTGGISLYNTGWGLSVAPTSTLISFDDSPPVNSSGQTYVAYLFASAPGVSKVGSYTGTGTTQTINCGFTAGSRFVMIKRTDSTGDWYVWDSARGIIAGDDPYLLLNSTAAEVTNTDYVDTASTGFEISSTAPAAINASGGTFIFLAIA